MRRGGAGAAQDGRDASQYKLWRTLVSTRRAAWPAAARSAHTKSLEPIGAIVQDWSARAGEPSRRAVVSEVVLLPSVRVRTGFCAARRSVFQHC